MLSCKVQVFAGVAVATIEDMPEEFLTTEQRSAQGGAAAAFAEAVAILARLRAPGGCPWDREQTLDSIKPHTLEEVYEVFDAIDRRAWDELRDELGDLLLQVIFYAQIAQDEGHFHMEDIARGLSAKLLRRHPHVFGDAVAETADAVVSTWELVKQQERAGSANHTGGLLDSVPRSMPGLLEARKLGSRAARIGFDWLDADGLFEKIQEEITEVRAEIQVPAPDAARVEEEFGDLLLVMSNLARHLHVDAEQALKKANAKFRRRFAGMEEMAGGTDGLRARTTAEMEELWSAVKVTEKQS